MRDLIKIIFDIQGEWSCWLPTWRTWQPGRRAKRATAITADLHHTTQVQMLLSLCLIVLRFLFETSRVSFSLKGLLSCGSLTLTYVHFPADSRSLFATTQSSQFHLRWSLFKTILTIKSWKPGNRWKRWKFFLSDARAASTNPESWATFSSDPLARQSQRQRHGERSLGKEQQQHHKEQLTREDIRARCQSTRCAQRTRKCRRCLVCEASRGSPCFRALYPSWQDMTRSILTLITFLSFINTLFSGSFSDGASGWWWEWGGGTVAQSKSLPQVFGSLHVALVAFFWQITENNILKR